jgi:aspartokinase-like uncharacterized kinase
VLRRQDELPHSWDVTSDTIAAWVAHKTASPLIKATDVDGIMINGSLQETIDASRLKGIETCIDKALPAFLIKHGMDAFIVNGLIAHRLEDLLQEKSAQGTRIIPK